MKTGEQRQQVMMMRRCWTLVIVFAVAFFFVSTTRNTRTRRQSMTVTTTRDDDDEDSSLRYPSSLLLLRNNNDKKKHNKSSDNDDAVQFPTLPDTYEMAKLSLLVYLFRHEPNETHVCTQINAGNFSLPTADSTKDRIPGRQAFADLYCHWYHHDTTTTGTQVMLVSSVQHNYLAVVFAGTDDLQTSLVDTDVRWERFGDGTNWTLAGQDATATDIVKVHAGFDRAVFGPKKDGVIVMNAILQHVTAVRQSNATLAALRLYVTGHSLGAAAAVLTAMALVEYYYPPPPPFAEQEKQPDVVTAPPQKVAALQKWWNPWSWHRHHHHHDDNHNNNSPSPPPPDAIVSLNFGCPRMGNTAYRRYFPHSRLHVWRVVLGWDLVPRLPDFFSHAGHTVQLSVVNSDKKKKKKKQPLHVTGQKAVQSQQDAINAAQAVEEMIPSSEDTTSTNNNQTRVALAYYQHYGNATLGWAGVPLGWGSRPYIWVPGALGSHHITRYVRVLREWQGHPWVHDFVPLTPFPPDDDDNTTNDDDDDAYVNPPFDDFPALETT